MTSLVDARESTSSPAAPTSTARLSLPSEPLAGMLSELARDAGLSRTPLLTTMSRISSPIALGVGEICVPETAITDLDVEQQRSMLAHELAHLARRDAVWLVVASLIERVLWFQPLNRVASRRIATAAEYICDDWAVRRTGSGVPLARCLAKVAEWIQASPLGVPVAGMAEERSNTVLAAKDSIGGAITDERAIKRLLAELDGSSACTRRVAAKMLGGSSIDAARLSGLLTHASANVRESAALAAGTGEHEVVLPALHRALDDRTPAVAAMVAWAIGQVEDASSVAPLLAVVRGSGDTRVRIAAVWALGQIEDARAVPDVITALRDPDAGVRAMSAEVLGDIEDDAGVGPLERALGSDGDPRVRAAAATSLGQLSSATSAGALGRALADADVAVRRAAAESLGELDDLRVAPPGLVAALSSPDAELRYRAAKALAWIADPATTVQLVGLLSNVDPELRKEAVEALGEIGTPAAVQGITRALGDKDAEVRKAAVEALGEVKEG